LRDFRLNDIPIDSLKTVQRLVEELGQLEDLKRCSWKDLKNSKQRREALPFDQFPLKGFINRTEALSEMLRYLDQYEEWDRKSDGTLPPMAAIRCGPGGGKSKLLSIISGINELSHEITDPGDLELYQKLRKRLGLYAPVAISLGSISPKDYERHPLIAVAIRALFS